MGGGQGVGGGGGALFFYFLFPRRRWRFIEVVVVWCVGIDGDSPHFFAKLVDALNVLNPTWCWFVTSFALVLFPPVSTLEGESAYTSKKPLLFGREKKTDAPHILIRSLSLSPQRQF